MFSNKKKILYEAKEFAVIKKNQYVERNKNINTSH